MRRFTKRIALQTCRLIRQKYFGLIFFCGLALYCTQKYGPERETRYYYMFNEGCKIPFMEVIDKDMTPFNYPYYMIKNCTNFTVLQNNNSHIWINIDPRFNVLRESVICCYQPFERLNTVEDINSPEKKRKVHYKPCQNFTDHIAVSSEFVKVSCSYERLNDTLDNYEHFFAFTLVKNLTTDQQKEKKWSYREKIRYNVIILGFSGMSRMNFYRTMGQTFSFLASKGSVEMQGYHKVSDNNFANMMPMLLGLREIEMRRTCWPHLEAHYDNCPFIWTLYQNASYYTALGDDYSLLNLFNFNRHGFLRTPTDYYLYPFIREATGEVGRIASKWNECIGNTYTFDVLLNYIGNLTRSLRYSKLFGFFWETLISNELHTLPEVMDYSYLNLLKNMDHSGYLNNTILFIVSNSGMRWGKIRFTKRGKIEEHLPVMQMLTPLSFRKKYSLAYENLIENMYRLTSPFDVYETLKDLADISTIENKNIKLRSEASNGRERGISLFLPITSKRTCADLGIEAHQCVCDRMGRTIKTDSTLALDAAKYLVEYLNNLLESYDYCATLQLKDILQVSKFVTLRTEEFVIVVVLTPENIMQSSIKNFMEFEATLHYDGGWKIVGEIHRTNALGYESRCLPFNHKYHELCYCYPLSFK